MECGMGYAEVCVNSPIAQRRTFSYSIPQGMNISIGHAVWIPFGDKLLQGIVSDLTDYPAVDETREIAGIIESQPVLSSERVLLAYWISQHYLSPLFDAVALMLPPGFERKPLTFISLSMLQDDLNICSLDSEYIQAFELVRKAGKVSLKELEKALGQKKAQRVVSQLVKRKLFTRTYEVEPIKARPKLGYFLSLSIDTNQARHEISKLHKKRAGKQAALLSYLSEQPKSGIPLAEARRKTGCTKTIVDTLVRKRLIILKQIEVRRDPLSTWDINLSYPLTLTSAQESAFQSVIGNLKRKLGNQTSVFLLHGVTGSGKTEVYLQTLAEVVKQGKKGIVLVPEIALTPQTIERFSSRFPGKVAVLHSQLSLGERFDEWQRIKNGKVDVVIGPRSVIFAPLPDLGLIIIDEEHEWTYKQTEKAPRYHTRDVAIKLAELVGAMVILGSATPDVESYYHAQKGDYHLLRLPERVVPWESAPLPRIEVVDLRKELKSGNRSIFSHALSEAISKAVAGGEQVMLFLNRRGSASFIQCRDCGFVVTCRRCDIPLTYHLAENTLLCHRCNYRISVPHICPRCKSRRIKFLGLGTQALEREAGVTFPQARLLRWDSDVTKGKNSHHEILEKFRNHQADILIGTQMVTKGLDLPRITIVGVVNADIALNIPDFRAGERTFQLVSQVAGRAGRGSSGGQVFIQTYSPENYAIQAAARHDYPLFFSREIDYRRQLNNPPFTRLTSLIFTHTNNAACQQEAERMRRLLVNEIDSKGIGSTSIIGPAPAFIHRLRGKFRWQLVLRGPEPSTLFSTMPFPRGWIIDIDPVGF